MHGMVCLRLFIGETRRPVRHWSRQKLLPRVCFEGFYKSTNSFSSFQVQIKSAAALTAMSTIVQFHVHWTQLRYTALPFPLFNVLLLEMSKEHLHIGTYTGNRAQAELMQHELKIKQARSFDGCRRAVRNDDAFTHICPIFSLKSRKMTWNDFNDIM